MRWQYDRQVVALISTDLETFHFVRISACSQLQKERIYYEIGDR